MAINVVDIERIVEKRYVIGLRAIFEIDNTFIYNNDDKVTQVVITPDYPEKGSTLKTPHLVVANMSYNMNLDNSLFSNYYQDVVDNTGLCIGQKYANIIPYTITVSCLAEFYISKDLANKVTDYIAFTAKEVFDYMYLNIQNVSKGPTSPQQQWGEHLFETIVSVQGRIEWSGTKTTDKVALQVLETVKRSLSLENN